MQGAPNQNGQNGLNRPDPNQPPQQSGWGGVQQGRPQQGMPMQGRPQQGMPMQGGPQQGMQGRPQGNPQNGGRQGPGNFLDFNRISEMPSKYPREDLAENY